MSTSTKTSVPLPRIPSLYLTTGPGYPTGNWTTTGLVMITVGHSTNILLITPVSLSLLPPFIALLGTKFQDLSIAQNQL